MPASHHVTQLFLGGNKRNLEHDIYKSYREGKKVQVMIKALVYVPGQLLTAVCFPKADVDNEFPHMTLLLGGNWTAKLSNTILQETCRDPIRFKLSYEESK